MKLTQRWLLVALAAAEMVACGARSTLAPGEESSTSSVGASGGNAPDGGMGGEAGLGGTGGMAGQGGEGGAPFDECTDPDVTFIYLVTSALSMYAYKPQTQELEYRGQLNCPSAATPFSMAVRRNGIAYVIFNDGSLWQASVKDASCEATGFAIGQAGFTTFGMGFVVDDDGMSETLFVSDIDYANQQSKGLASIDLNSFELQPVAPFSNNPGFRIELTAEIQDLYAFIIDSQVGGGHLARVDKTTGVMSELEAVPLGTNIGSWHFAWWGGEFYFFTSMGNQNFTSIRRYDKDTKILSNVGTVNEPVVGAGVSTCAPR